MIIYPTPSVNINYLYMNVAVEFNSYQKFHSRSFFLNVDSNVFCTEEKSDAASISNINKRMKMKVGTFISKRGKT